MCGRGWRRSSPGVFVFFGSGAENILDRVPDHVRRVVGVRPRAAAARRSRRSGRPIGDWLALAGRARGVDVLGRRRDDGRHRRDRDAAPPRLADRAVAHGAARASRTRSGSRSSPKGSAPVSYTSQSPVQVIKFVVHRCRRRCSAGSAQLPGLGVVLAAVLLVGLVVAIDREDLGALRRQFAVPIALLVGRRRVPARHRRSCAPASPRRIVRHRQPRARTRAPEPLRVPRSSAMVAARRSASRPTRSRAGGGC